MGISSERRVIVSAAAKGLGLPATADEIFSMPRQARLRLAGKIRSLAHSALQGHKEYLKMALDLAGAIAPQQGRPRRRPTIGLIEQAMLNCFPKRRGRPRTIPDRNTLRAKVLKIKNRDAERGKATSRLQAIREIYRKEKNEIISMAKAKSIAKRLDDK